MLHWMSYSTSLFVILIICEIYLASPTSSLLVFKYSNACENYPKIKSQYVETTIIIKGYKPESTNWVVQQCHSISYSLSPIKSKSEPHSSASNVRNAASVTGASSFPLELHTYLKKVSSKIEIGLSDFWCSFIRGLYVTQVHVMPRWCLCFPASVLGWCHGVIAITRHL